MGCTPMQSLSKLYKQNLIYFSNGGNSLAAEYGTVANFAKI